jgi:hypothetical protein
VLNSDYEEPEKAERPSNIFSQHHPFRDDELPEKSRLDREAPRAMNGDACGCPQSEMRNTRPKKNGGRRARNNPVSPPADHLRVDESFRPASLDHAAILPQCEPVALSAPVVTLSDQDAHILFPSPYTIYLC